MSWAATMALMMASSVACTVAANWGSTYRYGAVHRRSRENTRGCSCMGVSGASVPMMTTMEPCSGNSRTKPPSCCDYPPAHRLRKRWAGALGLSAFDEAGRTFESLARPKEKLAFSLYRFDSTATGRLTSGSPFRVITSKCLVSSVNSAFAPAFRAAVRCRKS